MHDMPLIQIQVTRMAETISHAMVVHHKEIQVEIDAKIAQAIRPENIQKLIDEECDSQMRIFVRKKVRRDPRWQDRSLWATVKHRVTYWFDTTF